MIAIAALYLTLVLHAPTREAIRAQSSDSPNSQPQSRPSSTSSSSSNTRRSSRSAPNTPKKPSQDIVGFIAGLSVNIEVVASIAQEIISLYTLWDRYKEDGHDATARTSFPPRGTKRTASGAQRSGSVASGGTSTSRSGTPGEESHTPLVVTPPYLAQLLVRMREARLADMAHPPNGRPMALDKRLERTQNA